MAAVIARCSRITARRREVQKNIILAVRFRLRFTMRSGSSWAISALLLASNALAALTTIEPCPQAPTSSQPAPITVTAQYQTVSTCQPTVVNGTTSYPYATTTYLSTTIPCAWDGTTSSSTLVTDKAQNITISIATLTTSTLR